MVDKESLGITHLSKLGTGNVPLKFREEVRPKPFVQSWAEWAADGNRQQVLEDEFLLPADTFKDFFTVPDGFTLMVTSAWLHYHGLAGFTPSGDIFLHGGNNGVGTVLLKLTGEGASNQDSFPSISLTFNMPMAINAGNAVRLFSGSSVQVVGGFQGWLEPKKI